MLPNLARYFRRRARDISRFRRARDGATAVEFALIAAPFLATLLAMLQTTLFLFAQAVLQDAANQAARQFMTGEAQNGGTTESQFVTNSVCPKIQTLFNCNNLMVNVQSYADFSSANASAPTLTFNAQGQVNNTWSYSEGAPGQVMVVQLIYEWPLIRGPFGYMLSNLGNGTTEIMGVSSFRVEPY
jgi:Flp pilus assembly protein TadG